MLQRSSLTKPYGIFLLTDKRLDALAVREAQMLSLSRFYLPGDKIFITTAQWRRLVDADISDPVPVASGNKFVLCSQAYEAVFDFIVANTELEDIELIGANRLGSPESQELDQGIRDARSAIFEDRQSTQECFDYVRSVIPLLEAAEIHRSIRIAGLSHEDYASTNQTG